MRYKGLLLLPLMLFIYSCQAIPSKFQPRENKSMAEAEEYINMALRGKDFSAIDTLLMLTEEYFKESSEILKEETARYENELGLYRGGKIKQEPAVPKADHARIINGYKAIIQKYPNKPGMSSALYVLGYALYEQGELEQALKVFEGFTERYKESPYYTEVNFRLGEIYFDTSQFRDAINAYQRILDRPDSIFYEKALYKSGWAYYKMDDYTGAIDLFSRIVDMRGRSGEAADSLAGESFHNIVRSMSRMKSVRDIEDAAAVIKLKSYAPDALLELVRLFVQETRYEEAISTYNIFKALFPDDADLPMLYKEMAGVYEKLNNNEEALRIKEVIVANYNPTAKLYAEKYPNGSKEVDRITAETLLDISKEYHRKGREKNDSEAFKRAVKGYEQYLYYFPNSADYKDVNILLAETLFDAKEYADAAVKYEYIMRLYKGRPQGEKAAYAALLAYELIAAQDVKKMEVSAAAVKRIVDYCKMEFSGSAGLENLIYKAADVYARLGYYREAKDIVSPLLKGSSQSYAYKKMGEIYIAEKDTPSAIDAYASALKASNEWGRYTYNQGTRPALRPL
ncbi:MAG: tetratricopeptide repeat protein [Deltaproteobacteria bacterium]|nr:tetratricopeptide repeat protein [Deltaproteobacteria bacterium]